MKKIIVLLWISFSCFSANISLAQSSPPYTGGLEYALPWLTTVPPVVSGMPSDIASAYSYFDLAMRLSPSGSTYTFFQNLGYGDTLKFLADYYYRVCDYNPVLFEQWLSANYKFIKPYPYKTGPGSGAQDLIDRVAQVFPDSDRTWMLLNSIIISHIHVNDTVMFHDATKAYPDWVVVNAQIVDEIKGQYILGCPLLERAGKGGVKPLSTSIFQTYPDSIGLGTGGAGTCIQFNYSYEGSRTPVKQGFGYYNDQDNNILFDSTSGTWIKPGRDYIVFLRPLLGLGGDSLNAYFTVWPQFGFGWSAGMYPIQTVSGSTVVVDPNDDFGIGASSGLSPDAWKGALRAKIYSITHP